VVLAVSRSADRLAPGGPGDRVRRPVRNRQRDEHRAHNLPDAGVRGARAAADLARQNARRHHAIPRAIHARTHIPAYLLS